MATKENLRLILDAVRDKYVASADVDNALISMAGVLLGFEVTLGIGYASFALTNLNHAQFIGAIIGLLLLGLSIISLLQALWHGGPYYYAISIKEAMTYLNKPEEELLSMLISRGYDAIKKNRIRRHRQRKLYNAAIVLLALAATLLIFVKLYP